MATGQQKILEVNHLIKRRNRFRTSYAPAVMLGILRNWKSGGRGTAYNSRVCAGGARLAEHEGEINEVESTKWTRPHPWT